MIPNGYPSRYPPGIIGKKIIKNKIKIHRAFWRNSHTLADISFSSFYMSF